MNHFLDNINVETNRAWVPAKLAGIEHINCWNLCVVCRLLLGFLELNPNYINNNHRKECILENQESYNFNTWLQYGSGFSPILGVIQCSKHPEMVS